MVLTQAGVGLHSVDHDPDTGSYRATFDESTTPPSLALVATLSTALDAEPTEIDPLYETVDPDAIDELLTEPDPSADPVTVSFHIERYEARLSSTGLIHLHPRTAGGNNSGVAPVRPA